MSNFHEHGRSCPVVRTKMEMLHPALTFDDDFCERKRSTMFSSCRTIILVGKRARSTHSGRS